MKITEKYKIRSIDTYECKDWLLNKHYAKRVPSIEYSFGLFDNNILIGICTFGTPPRVMNDGESIFNEYRVKTLELNRLVVNGGLEKNTLSYFVGKCLGFYQNLVAWFLMQILLSDIQDIFTKQPIGLIAV